MQVEERETWVMMILINLRYKTECPAQDQS